MKKSEYVADTLKNAKIRVAKDSASIERIADRLRELVDSALSVSREYPDDLNAQKAALDRLRSGARGWAERLEKDARRIDEDYFATLLAFDIESIDSLD